MKNSAETVSVWFSRVSEMFWLVFPMVEAFGWNPGFEAERMNWET